MSAAEVYALGWDAMRMTISLYVAFLLGATAHELGHVAFAYAGSIPVRLLSVGAGPSLLQTRIGEISIELRLVPLCGFAGLYPAGIARKYATMLFAIGGILGNVALIGIVACLDKVGLVPRWAYDWVGPVVLVQLYFIAVNSFPFTERRRGLPSDGLLLLRLLKRPAREPTADGLAYAARLAAYSGNADRQPSESAASSRISYQLRRADGSTDKDVRREVSEALRRELARGGLPREEELLVLDGLIGAALVFEEPATRPELDEWSRRALELAPGLETIRGSRGAALAVLGRHQEAKAMLEPLAAGAASSFDALMSQIFLARAEFGLGNVDTARRWARSAQTIAAAWQLLPADIETLLARTDAQLGSNATSAALSGS